MQWQVLELSVFLWLIFSLPARTFGEGVQVKAELQLYRPS